MLENGLFQVELILQPHTCSELYPWKYDLLNCIYFNESFKFEMDDNQ